MAQFRGEAGWRAESRSLPGGGVICALFVGVRLEIECREVYGRRIA